MHLAAFARNAVAAERVATLIAERGIRVHSLDRYYLAAERRRAGLVFGVGTADGTSLRRGLALLQAVLASGSLRS